MVMIEDDLRDLRVKISKMADVSIDMVDKATYGLFNSDPTPLADVIAMDNVVDRMDNQIDEMVVRICAIRQPEATDLRFILSAVKINVFLERVADNAVNIAEWAYKIIKHPPIKPYIDLPKMKDEALGMVKDAIEAFFSKDVQKSKGIIERDDIVDNYEIQIIRELFTYIFENPSVIKNALRLMYVARALERIADQATNIAELAIFVANGEVYKHRRKKE
ncbi:phosphate signaling complex protein PhoU [Hippea sp. KM1]|uniref:phosphate signaling complex protein PhoU n=1 Tax=Hippea sp. KM1 TaxID=944481 RepID=UPI00046D7255|nr:phosphate signaling complex protein PhoU [Hippea sp. KM1]